MRKTILFGCLWLTAFAVPGTAQLFTAIHVDVPFAFTAGNAHMAAGQYMLKTSGRAVLVSSMANEPGYMSRNSITLVQSNLRAPAERSPAVVFNKYGEDRYFLAKIWGFESGVQVVRTRQEKELITSRVIAQGKPETVTIVGRLMK